MDEDTDSRLEQVKHDLIRGYSEHKMQTGSAGERMQAAIDGWRGHFSTFFATAVNILLIVGGLFMYLEWGSIHWLVAGIAIFLAISGVVGILDSIWWRVQSARRGEWP